MITVQRGLQDVDRAKAQTRYQTKQIKQRQKPQSKHQVKVKNHKKEMKPKHRERRRRRHKGTQTTGRVRGVMRTYKHQEG